jgi:hypothetical protein
MIYVDGASNTYGDELLSPATQSWPILLGNKLNIPVLNNASKGKSNQHIVFDTINYCTMLQPTQVIIAFAPVTRKFFVRRENNVTVDFSITGSNSMFGDAKEFKEFHRLLFKYWSNYLFSAWEFLQSVVLLQSFLESRNIPFLMVNSDNQSDILNLLTITTQDITIKDRLLDAFEEMNDSQIKSTEDQLNGLYNLINHQSFYDFSWHFKKLVNFSSHPTAEQHSEIANFMFTLLQKNICLK